MSGEDLGYVRATGSATIVAERDTKEKMAGRVRFFKEHWESPGDSNYTLLEIEIESLEYL